jgi:hypothetical protein
MYVGCAALVGVWLALIVWEAARPARGTPGSRAAAVEGLLVLLCCSALFVAARAAGTAPATGTRGVGPAGLVSAVRQMPVRVLWQDVCAALAMGLWVWHLFGGGTALLVRLGSRRFRERHRAYLEWVRTPVGRACRVLFGGAVGLATFYCMLLRRMLLYLWV